MKPIRTLFRLLAPLLLVPLFSACQEPSSPPLDRDDVRFSEFYSEYLLSSGISEENGGSFSVDLDSATIASMLERHDLSMETLRRKSDLYRADPERWQRVLIRVRENLRKEAETQRR